MNSTLGAMGVVTLFAMGCSNGTTSTEASAEDPLAVMHGNGGARATSGAVAGGAKTGGTFSTGGTSGCHSMGGSGGSSSGTCFQINPSQDYLGDAGLSIPGAVVGVPANSFCNGDVAPNNPIDVCLTSYSNEESMPGFCPNGYLTGVDGSESSKIMTLGAVAIQATSNGTPLTLAQNASLPVTMTLPPGRECLMQYAQGQVGKTIWRYDPTTSNNWILANNANPTLYATQCVFRATPQVVTGGPACPSSWPQNGIGWWNCDVKVPLDGGIPCGGATATGGTRATAGGTTARGGTRATAGGTIAMGGASAT